MEIGPIRSDARLLPGAPVTSERCFEDGGDDLAVLLLASLVGELGAAITSRPSSGPVDLAGILDFLCLPMLDDPEALGVLVMLVGEAAVRPSPLSKAVERCRRQALVRLTERVAAAQRRGRVSDAYAAESIAGVACTVLSGLCLTAFAEGRRPTRGDYRAVRGFLVSAFA